MTLPSTRYFLPLLLVAFLANALLWSAVLPYNKGNDEFLHYSMAQFLVREGRIPVFGQGKDMFAFLEPGVGPKSSYALHPTAPFFISALFMKPVLGAAPHSDVFHIARLSSVLLGLGTVLVAYLVARLIFPEQPILRYGVPTFVAFQPQFVFMNSYINNDAFTFFVASLVIYFVIREMLGTRDSGFPGAVALGVLLGLVVVSKLNAYVLIPCALLAYGWNLRSRPQVLAARLAVLGAVALLVGGWWPLWNFVTYSGDLFALKVNREAWMQISPEWESVLDKDLTAPEFLFMSGYWWVLNFTTYWGSFGPTRDNVLPHMVLRLGVAVMMLGACIGFRYWLPQLMADWRDRLARPRVSVFFWMVGVVLLLSFTSFFNSLINAYQAQGRYLHPVVIPISALVVGSYYYFRPTPVRNDWLVLGVVYFMMGLCLMSLYAYVLPRYYPDHASYFDIFAAIVANNAWFFTLPTIVFLSAVLFAASGSLAWLLLQFCRQPAPLEASSRPSVALQPTVSRETA